MHFAAYHKLILSASYTGWSLLWSWTQRLSKQNADRVSSQFCISVHNIIFFPSFSNSATDCSIGHIQTRQPNERRQLSPTSTSPSVIVRRLGIASTWYWLGSATFMPPLLISFSRAGRVRVRGWFTWVRTWFWRWIRIPGVGVRIGGTARKWAREYTEVIDDGIHTISPFSWPSTFLHPFPFPSPSL